MAKMNWVGRAGRSMLRQVGSAFDLLINSRSASGLAVLGDRARSDGNWAEAARYYAASCKLNPNNSDITVQLGHAFKESGKLVAAERAYRDALALRPLHADTWLMLGHCLKMQGRTADALDAYVRAHHLEPWSEHALREVVVLEGIERLTPFATINNSRLQRLVADIEDARATIERLAANLPSLTSFASFAPANYDLYRRVYRLPPPPPQPPSPAADVRLTLSLDLQGWSSLGLRRFLASLARQSFRDWRLAIRADEVPLRDIAVLAAAADPRIGLDVEVDPGGWHLPISPEIVLDDSALAWFVWTITNTAATMVYCDDDRIDSNGVHSAPRLRGFFDPVAEKQDPCDCWLLMASGPGRVVEMVPVRAHIPLPLASLSSTQPLSTRPIGAGGEASALKAATGVSVIVPTRDRLDLLKPCIESLMAKAAPDADFEILIIDNGSTDAATLDYLREGGARGAFRVLPINEPFNWARLNNLAAKEAQKPLLLFLNNDTECLSDHWDRVVADALAEPEVGVAGAQLLYGDRTIQHAGIVFGFEHLVMHDGRHATSDTVGPEARWSRRRTASAVTGACLATPRALFESVGGFDERRFAISYNDVDFCLRVRATGKLVVYDPALTFFHYESKSRGLDVVDPAKHQRDEEEARLLRLRWGDVLASEPSASPHWARFAPPFTALAMPSLDRIADHVRRSARPSPWRVEQADEA